MRDELIQILTEIATAKGRVPSERELQDPDWHKAEGVRDWRNHVPDALQAIWPSFSLESRLCVYIMSEIEAGEKAD